jgi:hypothetical protein
MSKTTKHPTKRIETLGEATPSLTDGFQVLLQSSQMQVVVFTPNLRYTKKQGRQEEMDAVINDNE